jgi:hypothetical protein
MISSFTRWLTPKRRHGVFSPVFSSGGYLALLHLDSPDAKSVVSSVVKCGQASRTPHRDIARLLDESNWRPHIVAAVAVAALRYDPQSMQQLWVAFDSGSWVAPQLAVAAYLRDPNFCELAKRRILTGCPLKSSRLTSLRPLQRHVAAGPSGARPRSAKAAASLIWLASRLAPTPDWLAAEQSSRDLVTLLAEDVDQSALIAEHWFEKLQAHLEVPGIGHV